MKTLELNLPSPVLLVWGLPEDAQNIAIDENYPDRLCFDINIDTITHPDYRLLPEGNWQLIGRLSELTEEEAILLVDRVFLGYRDYDNKQPIGVIHYLDDALESFRSDIEAEGYHLTNPIPFPRSDIDGTFLDDYEIREYTSAQSKTLPANTLIFKRV